MKTGKDLDETLGFSISCSDCCNPYPLHIQSECHSDSGVEVMYEYKSNVLVISCKECGELVEEVLVLPRRDDDKDQGNIQRVSGSI